jgi:hypothetical protein
MTIAGITFVLGIDVKGIASGKTVAVFLISLFLSLLIFDPITFEWFIDDDSQLVIAYMTLLWGIVSAINAVKAWFGKMSNKLLLVSAVCAVIGLGYSIYGFTIDSIRR